MSTRFSIGVRLVRTSAAFTALEGCQRMLFQNWHVDGAALTPERAPVPLDTDRVFSFEFYPPDAVRQGKSGRVIAVVEVTANGGVGDCRVVAAAHPLLDSATCRRAKKLHFTPGKDQAGRPAPAPYILPVRWIMAVDRD